MIGTILDIFRKLPDGQPMWIKAVEGLNEANRQVSELASRRRVITLFSTRELAE